MPKVQQVLGDRHRLVHRQTTSKPVRHLTRMAPVRRKARRAVVPRAVRHLGISPLLVPLLECSAPLAPHTWPVRLPTSPCVAHHLVARPSAQRRLSNLVRRVESPNATCITLMDRRRRKVRHQPRHLVQPRLAEMLAPILALVLAPPVWLGRRSRCRRYRVVGHPHRLACHRRHPDGRLRRRPARHLRRSQADFCGLAA